MVLEALVGLALQSAMHRPIPPQREPCIPVKREQHYRALRDVAMSHAIAGYDCAFLVFAHEIAYDRFHRHMVRAERTGNVQPLYAAIESFRRHNGQRTVYELAAELVDGWARRFQEEKRND